MSTSMIKGDNPMEEFYRNDMEDIHLASINYEELVVVEGEIERTRVRIEGLERRKEDVLERLRGIEEELRNLNGRLERLVEERRMMLEPGG